MLAHVNTSGTHIPLWMVAPMSAIGWGQSPGFPTREGTFFGNIFAPDSSGNVRAHYCAAATVSKDTVPGRLGANQSGAPYTNPYPSPGYCDSACTMGGTYGNDGAAGCPADNRTWSYPVTVWRGQTFQAENTTLSGSAAPISCSQCGGGNRVGYIGMTSTVTLKNVNVAQGGTNSLVVYYVDGDPSTYNPRAFNISVNGGAQQYTKFYPTGGSWSDNSSLVVGSVNVSLTGFNAGSNNTVTFAGTGDGIGVPDLDWVEVIASPGANSSQLTLVGATSSSNYSSAYNQQNAIDGNMGTRWASNNNDQEWLYVDLGSTKTVSEVKINWAAATYGKNYTIEVSNDHMNWTTIKTVTNGDGGTDDWTGLSGTGRYVLMRGSAGGTAYGYSISEMQVFGH
jgi:hypothetical protein